MKKVRVFRQLNQNDRDRLEILTAQGMQQNDIATVLGVSPSCISRELMKKKKDGTYKAVVAQHKAQVQRGNAKYQGMKIEKYPELKKRIIKELKDKQSPDGIAGRLKKEGVTPRVSTDAIYRWLQSSFGQKYCKYLCTKRYHKKKQTRVVHKHIIPNMTSIHDISYTGDKRTQGDTFLSPKKVSKTSAVLVVWEVSKLLQGDIVPNLKPTHTQKVMRRIHAHHQSDLMILDQGIENVEHEAFGVPTFFCDPASPRQKPLIESSIGLCRRWFWPKGTDLSKISREEFQEKIEILNNKYRKSLHYGSANEVSRAYGILK